MNEAIHFTKHESNHEFRHLDGQLLIAGKPIIDLATQCDGKAFYAYDGVILKQRVQQLKNQLPDSIHLHFAVKANPFRPLVEMMAKVVDGLDVASGKELTLAKSTIMPAERISFAGPGKSEDELEQAVQAGITINIESELEAARLSAISKQLKKPAHVAIRVNPNFSLKASGMQMSGGAQVFGIDEERVPTLLKELPTLGLAFEGFHIFSGSQNLRADAIIEAQQATFELVEKLSAFVPSAIKSVNIGGGFGIPYFPRETSLDTDAIGKNLHILEKKFAERFPEAHLIVELGRFLVGTAGIYMCKVTDKKISRGKTFVITNGGLHHHLAASGNFGQVLRKNYPVAVANKINHATSETVSVVGPLCTPLDLLAHNTELPAIEVGDWIAVFQSGAYGASASPQDFLSHPHVAEFFIELE